jgi:hypothetical protein
MGSLWPWQCERLVLQGWSEGAKRTEKNWRSLFFVSFFVISLVVTLAFIDFLFLFAKTKEQG